MIQFIILVLIKHTFTGYLLYSRNGARFWNIKKKYMYFFIGNTFTGFKQNSKDILKYTIK